MVSTLNYNYYLSPDVTFKLGTYDEKVWQGFIWWKMYILMIWFFYICNITWPYAVITQAKVFICLEIYFFVPGCWAASLSSPRMDLSNLDIEWFWIKQNHCLGKTWSFLALCADKGVCSSDDSFGTLRPYIVIPIGRNIISWHPTKLQKLLPAVIGLQRALKANSESTVVGQKERLG